MSSPKEIYTTYPSDLDSVFNNPANYDYVDAVPLRKASTISLKNGEFVERYECLGYEIYHITHLASGDTLYKMRRLRREG